jgi:hypothetical protein
MSIKSKLAMMSVFGILAMTGTDMPRSITENLEPKETDEEKKQRLAKAEIERNKANGLKEFFYPQGSFWALNEKNANRKAKKLGWLK